MSILLDASTARPAPVPIGRVAPPAPLTDMERVQRAMAVLGFLVQRRGRRNDRDDCVALPAPMTWMRKMRHPTTGAKVQSPRRQFDADRKLPEMDWDEVRAAMRSVSLTPEGRKAARRRRG